ncbi:sigma-54-dependent transcriptional regulator [Sphingosinithalassobacter portus]|uniref:sigma-54-dependent transcriptional regulator n=1 Tax=Stakelama portus TaxID=2676234 RepID=UPI000D6E1934|nr:sigma-54 dependent transcriptional regulator [Sphingosinithalassobacter portus]
MTDATPVLLVDDDDDLRASLAQMLTLSGYDVRQARNGREALQKLERDFAGPVITDVRMPTMDGIELLGEVAKVDPDLPVILLTGHGDVAMAVAALKSGAWDFLTKPFDPDELTRAVDRAADKRRLTIENRTLRAKAAEAALASPIIGRTPAIEQLRNMLAALARTPLDLLIEGESGTGKDLAARTLHHSAKSARKFVVIPCAAITDTMVLDALFAPTGPVAGAEGGTLLIDNLHRASPLLQSRLAEFAERRLIGNLDRGQARPITCRIVATVTGDDDLSQLDPALIHRISGMKVTLPPLRERREDIPLLLTHFLENSARSHGRDVFRPDHAILDRAMTHRWPGNIRELEAYAERLTLGLETETASPSEQGSLASRVDAFERAQIVAALAATDGNIVETIERLGLPRKTFYYKARRLGIEPGQFRKAN